MFWSFQFTRLSNGVHLHGLGGTYSPIQQQQIRADGDRYVDRIYYGSAENKNKNAETICDAYRSHIYCMFRGGSRILTDNGSEFKNLEMRQVCETLGVKHIFPQCIHHSQTAVLEGWHRLFKASIAKHIQGGGVKWDELVPLAVSAYNFFPCQSSKESPFILMFGRDPITPVAKLLEPRPRYYGERGSALKWTC